MDEVTKYEVDLVNPTLVYKGLDEEGAYQYVADFDSTTWGGDGEGDEERAKLFCELMNDRDLDALRQRCEAITVERDEYQRQRDYYDTKRNECLAEVDRLTDHNRALAAQVETLTKRLRHCNCCGKDADISDPENAPVFVKCAVCDTKDCDKLTAAEQRVRELEAWIDRGESPLLFELRAENARLRERLASKEDIMRKRFTI